MMKLLLLVGIAFAVSAQALERDLLKLQHNFAKTILKSSSDLDEISPRNIECFLIYSPQISRLTDEYESAYASCMEESETAKDRIDADVLEDRNNIEALGNEICSSYGKCSEISASADYFECYNKAAGLTISSSYDIQTVSKASIQHISLRQQMIKYNEDSCTEKCRNTYIQESTKVYNALDECLANGGPVPEATTKA